MKLFKLAVTFTVCIILVKIVTAKSEGAIQQDAKLRFTQKLNAVSSTAKPDIQYETVQDYNVQQPKQSYQPYFPPQQQQIAPQQIHFQQAPNQFQQAVVPQLHPQSQQQILQFIQRALYMSQQQSQPTAMIIIAQPAIVPRNVVYGNPAQQLVNYYQNNPQARYQFLHANRQAQPIQQSVQLPIQQPQQIVPQNQGGTYQMIPVAVQYQPNVIPAPTHFPVTTHMSPAQASESYTQQKPQELSQISQIAQLAAQKYFSYPSHRINYEPNQPGQTQAEVPVRSIPPIITGFENFTPEQQAKIKEQLSAHFGAPLQPLPIPDKETSNQIQNNGQFSTKYQTVGTRLNSNDFNPSQQVKPASNNEQESSYTKI